MMRRTLLLVGVLAALVPVYVWSRSWPVPAAPAVPAEAPAPPPDRRAELEARIRAQPTDAAALTGLSAEYARAGDLESARKHLERAVRLDAYLPEARHNLGLLYLNTFQPERAVEQFTRELELRPGDAQVHLSLGQAHLSARRAGASLRHLRLASRLAPADPEIDLWLARAANFAGQRAEAEQVLLRAARNRVSAGYAWYLLGRLYAAQQRDEEALAAAREAVARTPDQPYYHLFHSQVLEDQRRHPEAIQACRRALELKPDFAAAAAHLGHCLVLERRHEEALPALKRALELDPDRWSVYPDLAAAYRGLGRQEDSDRLFARVREYERLNVDLKVWRQRTDVQPRNADAWFELGRVAARANQLQEAEAALRTALRVRPSHAAAAKLLRQVRARSGGESSLETR